MKRTLFTLGLGASLMYFFDPQEGPLRRELLREKFESLLPKTNEALHEKADEISAKAHSLTEKADEAAAEAIATAKLPVPEAVSNLASSNSTNSTPPETGSA